MKHPEKIDALISVTPSGILILKRFLPLEKT